MSKIKVIITLTMEMTKEQYESNDIQDVLQSINNGEMQRDLIQNNKIDKVTATYTTNAKTKS